jgi:ABC-type transporter Mla subunit MlaD
MTVAAVNPIESASANLATPSRPPAASASGGDVTANVSASGALLSRLQLLAQQDPSKLTAIASQAAQDLRQAATATTGDAARGLNRLAAGFEQTASTGDVSSLSLDAKARAVKHHHASLASKSYAGTSGSGLPQTAAAKLEAVSLQVDQALGLTPPPLGPWGNE